MGMNTSEQDYMRITWDYMGMNTWERDYKMVST